MNELDQLKAENEQLLIQLEIATNGLTIARRNMDKMNVFFETAIRLYPDLLDSPGIEDIDMELEEIPTARFSHGHCKQCRRVTGYLRPLLRTRRCPICGWQKNGKH